MLTITIADTIYIIYIIQSILYKSLWDINHSMFQMKKTLLILLKDLSVSIIKCENN